MSAETVGSTIPSRSILNGSTGGTAKARLRPSIKQGNVAKSNPCARSAQSLVNAVTGQLKSWYGICPIMRLLGTLGIRNLPGPDLWTGYNRDFSRLYAEKNLIAIHPVEDEPTNCKHRQSFEQRLQTGASDREGMGTQVDGEGRKQEFG
jgi:hypothetical protein